MYIEQHIPNNKLLYISKFKALQELHFISCTDITVVGLQSLSVLPALQTLEILSANESITVTVIADGTEEVACGKLLQNLRRRA